MIRVRIEEGASWVGLVAEDLRSGGVLASCRLHEAIGLTLPRYSYHVGCVVHASRELGLFQRQRTLYLSNDHTGASELAEIEWAPGQPEAHTAAALALLLQTSLLWMAQHRRRFADRLVVAVPGVVDADGVSPFWNGLGRAFVAAEPAQIALEHGADWKSHLASLLPRHPVYASFLPEPAQAAMAQPAARMAPWIGVLEDAGLRYGHHIDLHDGGPVLEAAVGDLPAVRTSRVLTLACDDTPVHSKAGARAWVAMMLAEPCRAVRLSGVVTGDTLQVPREMVKALGAEAGARVRAVSLGL